MVFQLGWQLGRTNNYKRSTIERMQNSNTKIVFTCIAKKIIGFCDLCIGGRRAGTVGMPLPGVEVHIADPDSGKELVQGEIGSVEIRGPNVFKGYWQMPEKTKEEFCGDGFFITGDIGTMDGENYLSIVGCS